MHIDHSSPISYVFHVCILKLCKSRSCFATEMYFVKKNLQFTFPCEFSVTAQDDNYLINYYLSLFTEASQIQFTGNYKIEKP